MSERPNDEYTNGAQGMGPDTPPQFAGGQQAGMPPAPAPGEPMTPPAPASGVAGGASPHGASVPPAPSPHGADIPPAPAYEGASASMSATGMDAPSPTEPIDGADASSAGASSTDARGDAAPQGRAALRAAKKAAARKGKGKKGGNGSFIAILVSMSLMLIVGVGLILYPTIADAWNRHVASRVVAGYVEQVANTSKEDREAQLARAREYNEALVGRGVTRFIPNEEEKKEYESILDVTGTGIIGYVTIPKIDARLPIYHGTEESVLQIASGHMEGSSFPIGGESTHAVLTGHTGLPSAMLFTGIDTLDKGDTFSVTVYDEVLTYEVEETNVVLPDNVKNLDIQEGRDLVSLVTCTPYGVNSHRLIVTGKRIPTPEEAKAATYENKALKQDLLITAIVTAATIAALVTVFTVQRRRLRGAGKPSHHAKASAADRRRRRR